jgi:choline dehydrogenase
MIAAIRLTRKFFSTPELREFIVNEELPGPAVVSDDDLLDFARRCGTTIYHFNGTCRMGPPSDKEAVVSPSLKIYGVENLRIADASIMPTTPSSNTYAPTLMIAEKAADLIRADR